MPDNKKNITHNMPKNNIKYLNNIFPMVD